MINQTKSNNINTVIGCLKGCPKCFPCPLVFRSNKDTVKSNSGPNVSTAAQSGSHITAPVLTNNTITGNVHIIHNAPGK